jgi:hypothetical protein
MEIMELLDDCHARYRAMLDECYGLLRESARQIIDLGAENEALRGLIAAMQEDEWEEDTRAYLGGQDSMRHVPHLPHHQVESCSDCPFVLYKWGDGPAECGLDEEHRVADPNAGSVQPGMSILDTPPDWCPLRKETVLVELVK